MTLNIIPVSLLRVETSIAQAAGITIEELRMKDRRPLPVAARHAVWLIAVDYLKYSLSRVGEIYERDHTTILYGVQKLRGTLEETMIVEGIMNSCPDVFELIQNPSRAAVVNWKFIPQKREEISPQK